MTSEDRLSIETPHGTKMHATRAEWITFRARISAALRINPRGRVPPLTCECGTCPTCTRRVYQRERRARLRKT